MLKKKLTEEVKKWPTQPGVYVMKDAYNRILYVGKAKNLRNRIKSYFLKEASASPKLRSLVSRIEQIEFTVTANEVEALLLECNLIKKHRPRYNVRLRDDKNFPYFVLSFNHDFPQFKISRRVKPARKRLYFGPYSAGVNELSRFLLKTFQVRDCSDAKFKNRSRPCLNYEIGTCTAPCVGYVTKEQYAQQVQEAILFLKGQNSTLLKELQQQMQRDSDALEFEKARIIRDKIISLKKISEKQSAVLKDRERNLDVLGIYEADGFSQFVLLFVRGGFLIGKKNYRVRAGLDSLKSSLTSLLSQIYVNMLIPDEIWVPIEFEERSGLESFLGHLADKKVVVRVGKTKKQEQLIQMAHENARLVYEESKNRNNSGLEELQKVLSLSMIPNSVEGIDISNLQQDAPVGSLVHFDDGVPNKARYRIYYPKQVVGQNDFAMIREVMIRRLEDKENPPPDVFMIDGGKGQLSAAVSALEELGLSIAICSLAKSRSDSAFTRKEIERSEERIFVPGRKNPIVLTPTHPALRLLQQVRDEAHRFGVKAHRRRRDTYKLRDSSLTEIPGIGEKTREKLLRHFGSVEILKAADESELLAAGATRSQIKKIRDYFDD